MAISWKTESSLVSFSVKVKIGKLVEIITSEKKTIKPYAISLLC